MAIVYGFGGLRVYDGRIHLDPYVPERWRSYSFKVLFREARVKVDVGEHRVGLALVEGDSIELDVRGQTVALDKDRPVAQVGTQEGRR